MEPESIPETAAESAAPLSLNEILVARRVTAYRCPGEVDAISEGVHLSRLATFYHKCRHCEHRTDVARLAPSLQRQWAQFIEAPEQPRLFQTDGVRGLYLNQLTRNEASQVAAAFVSTLREVVEIWRTRHPAPPSRWLKVIFGHDTRPSSPDLAIAAATTLRQHGCELVDLGWSVRPQLDLVLKSRGADGAFFITGHGSPTGWNGCDLVGPDGIVWSRGGVLDLVEQRFQQSCPRPEREAAPQTPFDATGETLAVLRRELHGLRPLNVAIECREPTLERLLSASFADWPGALQLRALSEAGASPGELGADVAFRIGEDARQCEMFDEAGQRVSERSILFGLGEQLLTEHPHVDVVLSDELFDRSGWTVERCGPGYLVFHRGGASEEQLLRTMQGLNSSLGVDRQGRYWIRKEGQVRCEGWLTAAMILKSMSRTDGRASEWCH